MVTCPRFGVIGGSAVARSAFSPIERLEQTAAVF
jgi:hypothetical protein